MFCQPHLPESCFPSSSPYLWFQKEFPNETGPIANTAILSNLHVCDWSLSCCHLQTSGPCIPKLINMMESPTLLSIWEGSSPFGDTRNGDPIVTFALSHYPWGNSCLFLNSKWTGQPYLDVNSNSYRLHYYSIVSGLFVSEGLKKNSVHALPPEPLHHAPKMAVLTVVDPGETIFLLATVLCS